MAINKELYFNLYKAERNISRHFANLDLKKYKLSYPQFLVLNILWHESPVNVKTVVEKLKLDTGTVSPLLKRMVEKGLIKKERSEIDQREVYIHLTNKSTEIGKELENVIDDNKAISSLTLDEVVELNRILIKILNT